VLHFIALAPRFSHPALCHRRTEQHRRHPEVLAASCGEPRRMGHKRKRPSFETPRKRAAPPATTAQPLREDDGGVVLPFAMTTASRLTIRQRAAAFINSKPRGELRRSR
jgi:hypothetical protein